MRFGSQTRHTYNQFEAWQDLIGTGKWVTHHQDWVARIFGCQGFDGSGRLQFGQLDVDHSDDDFSAVLWVMAAHLSHIVMYTGRGNGLTRHGFEPNGTEVMLQNEC